MKLIEKLEDYVGVDALLKLGQIGGVGAGEKGILLAGLKAPFIYLCADITFGNNVKKQLEALGLSVGILAYGIEDLPGEGSYRQENLYPFFSEIFKFIGGETHALIVLPHVAISPLPKQLGSEKLEVRTETEFSLRKLAGALAEFGYMREEAVNLPMQFAVRGDILDVFPVTEKMPVRINFFDDFVEKISYFDPETMKSGENLEKIRIFPCFVPNSSDQAASILDYAKFVVIDGPKRVTDEIRLLRGSAVCSKFMFNEEYIINRNHLTFTLDSDEFGSPAKNNYVNDYKALLFDIKQNISYRSKTVLFLGDEFSKGRMKNFLTENELSFEDFDDADGKPKRGSIFVSGEKLPLSASFKNEGVVFIGTSSLVRSRPQISTKNKEEVFYLPKVGDFVVHSFHGIGRCREIKRLKISDYEKDYFIIEYAGGGVLYLPGDEANLITAYLGGDESPKLNKLGGGEFLRIKARVKAGLADLAGELIKLYRERESTRGFKYASDSYLEAEFEKAFPFEETPDQLEAINDVKKDMETGRVMDRLVCGDVGYGKTEVALRAAFKAITSGKQVVFLCPTTILSEQHYKTVKSRMEGFMVRAELLNRFKSPSQVKEILDKVKNGDVDILVGTHKILRGKVAFKDLGLLILDEEQRFGVKDKEIIKHLKKEVGVLSLSATPIPRTLHMSLSGIRDISLLTTPPKERLPVQTYVADYSDDLLKEVVSRELARGGITFIVYNRVADIYSFAARVKELLPHSKIGVAHGQMKERELESVIGRLYDGEYNILIATTLIENGIDLPLANTLFIVDADRLGLSQLYQIKGRVGRSNRLAYAYLTYEGNKMLTTDAYKRLETINEHRELGSGFKIAMRDLEIRGAGNVLGREQHGHLEKVGYDMYVKLLEEVLSEKSSGSFEEVREIKLEVATSAFLSDSYISSEEEKIKIYRAISDLDSREALNALTATLNDAFGKIPIETLNLMKTALIKNLAVKFGIKNVVVASGRGELVLYKREGVIDPRLQSSMKKYDASLKIGNLPIIIFDVQGMSNIKVLEKVLNFLCTADNFKS